jgi:hypothetical protein
VAAPVVSFDACARVASELDQVNVTSIRAQRMLSVIGDIADRLPGD